MKIGFISLENPYCLQNNGGIGTYTGVIAEGLSDLGHEVHIITIGSEQEKEYQVKNNLLLHQVSLSGTIKYCSHLEQMLEIFYKVKQVKEVYGLDLVETPEWMAQGFIVATEKLVPVVTRLHTPLFLIENIGEGQKIYKEQDEIKKLERLQTLRSVAVTSPSTSLANIAKENWGIEARVLYNPINLKKLQEADTDRGTFEHLGSYILYMGRLEYRKGVITLAKSLSKFLDDFPELKIVFCGQNTFYKKKSIKSLICEIGSSYKEQLHFIDHINAGEKLELIKGAKAVVLPSLWENFSYVALEALAMGSTLIATDTGGFSEMIVPGRSGYVVEADNAEALGEVIGKVLCKELSPTGEEAIKRVRCQFDINKLALDFSAFYEKLV